MPNNDSYENVNNRDIISMECNLMKSISCIHIITQACLQLQANHPQALTNLGNIYMEAYVHPHPTAAQCFEITGVPLLSSV